MPTNFDHAQLAKTFRRELDKENLAFKSFPRRELTDRLREISGEPNARISTATVADDIDRAFSTQGLLIFPRLQHTGMNDWVRVWRGGTRAMEIIELVSMPSEASDRLLGDMTKKIKGTWQWTDPEETTASK